MDVEEQPAVVARRRARIGAEIRQRAAAVGARAAARADDVAQQVLRLGFAGDARPAVVARARVAARTARRLRPLPGEVAVEVDAVVVRAAHAVVGVGVLAPGEAGFGFLPAVGIALQDEVEAEGVDQPGRFRIRAVVAHEPLGEARDEFGRRVFARMDRGRARPCSPSCRSPRCCPGAARACDSPARRRSSARSSWGRCRARWRSTAAMRRARPSSRRFLRRCGSRGSWGSRWRPVDPARASLRSSRMRCVAASSISKRMPARRSARRSSALASVRATCVRSSTSRCWNCCAMRISCARSFQCAVM